MFFYILSRRKICCCWWHDICRWSDRVIERQQNIGVPASQPASKSVILIKDYIEPGWQSLLPWVAWEAAVLVLLCCWHSQLVLLRHSKKQSRKSQWSQGSKGSQPTTTVSPLTTTVSPFQISHIGVLYSVNNLTSSHFMILTSAKIQIKILSVE